jgi:addiction module RelB/DinJ family antitoxin
MSYAVITTKVDVKTKEQASRTAEALGIPLSVVIKALLKQFIRTKSLYVSIESEEPTATLLSDLRNSEDDEKAGRVTYFDSGEEALTYLDREIKHEKKRKGTTK